MSNWTPTIEEYHRDPAVSSSSMSDFRKSPRYYEARHITHTIMPPEPTDNMVLGSLVHLLALEPHNFERSFAVQSPEIKVRRGKAWEEFKTEHADKEILRIKDFNRAAAISAALKKNAMAMSLLRHNPGDNEISFKWQHHTGLHCRCRFDRITSIGDTPAVVDMKIWSCLPNPDAIRRQYENLNVMCQRAFYRQGYLAMTGESAADVLIIVHKEPPYSVNIVMSSIPLLQVGHRRNEELLAEMAIRFNTGDWSDFGEDKPYTLHPSPWIAKEVAGWKDEPELQRTFHGK